MLTETGEVMAIDDDGLWIETLKQSACAKCAAQHGCGQKLLVEVTGKTNFTYIKAYFNQAMHGDGSTNQQHWVVGDRAVIGVSEHALVMAAMMVYGLPLILMVAGMAVGYSVNGGISQELTSIIGAIVGLFVGALAVKWHSRLAKSTDLYRARVLAKEIKSQVA